MIDKGHGHMDIHVTSNRESAEKRDDAKYEVKKECGGNSIWFDDVGVKSVVTSTFSHSKGM
jgi:hypothetical protein